jgi:hypothetical protein
VEPEFGRGGTFRSYLWCRCGGGTVNVNRLRGRLRAAPSLSEGLNWFASLGAFALTNWLALGRI